MIAKIDVVYFNGEAVSCQAEHVPGRKNGAVLELTRNLLTDVVFRFCNIDGMPLAVIAPEDFGKAQVLLSCRDRVLTATEENIVLAEDEAGFYSRLGFANIDESVLNVEYKFSYTSGGGMAKRTFSVPMTEETIVELITALDLNTYKIMCFNDSWEVEYYGDNVPV